MIEERTLRLKAYDDLTGIGEYKSPIELIESRIRYEKEDMVLKAIQKMGVNVDKDELIRALKYDRNQFEMGYWRGLEVGKRVSEWIPCDEELPEEDQKVLCSFENGNVDVWTYRVSILWESPEGVWCNQHDVGLIAWMPLPEAYSEED